MRPVLKEPTYEDVLLAYWSFAQSPSGQLVLEDMKKQLDGRTFTPGMDPATAAYNAGRRSVYLDLIEAIKAGDELAAAPGTSLDEQAE